MDKLLQGSSIIKNICQYRFNNFLGTKEMVHEKTCQKRQILDLSQIFHHTCWRQLAFSLHGKRQRWKSLYLKRASDTHIRRHRKIKAEANPFDPRFKEYFMEREKNRKAKQAASDAPAGLKIISLMRA